MAAHLNIDSELLTVKLNPIASSVWSSNNFLPFHLVNLIAYKWSTYRLSLKRKKFKFLFDNDITWICFKTDSFYWKLLHISDLIRVNSKLLLLLQENKSYPGHAWRESEEVEEQFANLWRLFCRGEFSALVSLRNGWHLKTS